ncbi:family 20 glycosylhydrolase [Kamptonema cortianum]|nr:family 20 glycosylhydrolase [Geitlerinema splendidum]MDK3157077.1 family 20 glycosylhydrolase [Kamptonema cortianum]
MSVLTILLALSVPEHSYGRDSDNHSLIPKPYAISTNRSEIPTKLRINWHSIKAEHQPVLRAFLQDWHVPVSAEGAPLEIVQNLRLSQEEYKLRVGDRVRLEVASPVALAWALQSLGQILSTDGTGVDIHDKPDVPFRAVMIDVARRYHSISTLRTIVRYCQVAKIRYIQLHLTDDQNWMLPSPVVAGIEKHNRHGKPTYTKEELKDLIQFASDRGISVYPEIDVPGHSSLLIALDPGTYKIQGSESTNCINFASEKVRNNLKQIIRDAAEIFGDAEYIHLGGDEAWYPNVDKDPHFIEAFRKLGSGSNPSQVFVDFVAELSEEVLRLGKTPIVWEGFGPSEFAQKRIPSETIIVAWENHYYPADQLAAHGYKVINAGWDPNYVVNHYPYDSFTVVPLERFFSTPADRFGIVAWSGSSDPGFIFPPETKLIGSLMCYWEGHEWNTHVYLPSRMVAFGTRLWNQQGERDYATFLERWADARARVNRQSYPFAVSLTGHRPGETSQFTDSLEIKLTSRNSDLRYAWRIDGNPPTWEDIKVRDSFTVGNSCQIAIQAFDGREPVGDTLFLPVHKVTVVENLALNCPVTTSGLDDLNFPASLVTDGVADQLSAFWLSYPNPQTVTIDLGKVQSINRLEVVTFWATGGPSLYKLSVSEDGRIFHQVVDFSQNKEKSTPAGYRHQISETQARFVRLEALGGSVFPSTMTRINEIRVFYDAK